VRARGKETPSKPESSRDGDEEEDEHEEEGEITPSPHSSPPEDLPSLGDLLSQQTGISISVRQTRCPRTGTGASSNLPPQSGLALVYFDQLLMSVCTGGDGNNLLAQSFIGPTTLTGRRGCYVHDGGVILIRHWGCGALVQEDPPLVSLPVSSQYVHGVCRRFTPIPLLLFLP
jgi:hypothetical protein